MMQFIRNHSTSWFAKILFIGIGVSFLGFGGANLFGGGGSSRYVAEVNGHKVAVQSVDEIYTEMIRTGDFAQYINKNQEDLTDEDRRLLKEQAYTIVESRVLAAQLADRYQIVTTDAEVANAIRSIEFFRDGETGQFDKARYEDYLRQTGTVAAQFENSVRSDLTNQKLVRYLALGAVSGDSRLAELAAIENATGSFELVTINYDQFKGERNPVTLEEIEQLYELKKSELITDNRVKLAYIHIKADDYLDQVEISDEAIKQGIAQLETRTFDRIEIAATSDAEKEAALSALNSVYDEIASGELSFEKAAESDAVKAVNGHLVAKETIKLGAIGDAAFDAVLFDLDLNAPLSKPFATDTGVYMLSLTGVKNVMGSGIDVTSMVRNQLAEPLVADLYYAAQEKFEKLAETYRDDLESIANELGAEVITTDWLSLDQKEGVLENDEFYSSVAYLDLANTPVVSAPFAPGENEGALVKVIEFDASHAMTLDEAKPLLTEVIKRNKLRMAMAIELDQLKDKAESGAVNLETYAKEQGYDFFVLNDLAARYMDPSALNSIAFEALMASYYEQPVAPYMMLHDGAEGIALVNVKAFKAGSIDDYSAIERQEKRGLLQNDQANYELNAIFEDFKSRSKVKRLANPFMQ